MARGGKASSKRHSKKRVKHKDSSSDDSDEDYVVSDEENEVSGDYLGDYCNLFDLDPSDESFGSFVNDKELEEEEKESTKVVKSKTKKGYLAHKRKQVTKTSLKRKRVSYEEEKDDDYEDEDYIYDERDDLEDEDDELVPYQEDFCEDKEDSKAESKEKTNKSKWKKSSMLLKKPLTNKGRDDDRSRRKIRFDDDYDIDHDDLLADCIVVRKKSRKVSRGRKRKLVVSSDSDYASSEASEYKYTISEEEREQIKEAGELYVDLGANFRSSLSTKIIAEKIDEPLLRKLPKRKGKEKVEEQKLQVCGICLSEEDKRQLRGILDCCSHYFCFTCIMEWSKVESRCPLCKQRFKTIVKSARSNVLDLRDVVIQIPERDQVYQPSEEELQSYLDQYENVVCSECHEGGDDGLMLLCDLCDSSAHTYCVGLRRQVPEGNWYCEGCKPIVLGSSSSQAQVSVQVDNLESRLVSPTQGNRDIRVSSQVSGAWASTLHGRRLRRRPIQNFRYLNRMNFINYGVSNSNLTTGFANSWARTREMEASHRIFLEERLQNSHSMETQSGDFCPSGLSHSRTQSTQQPVNLTLWPEHELFGRSSVLPDCNLSPYINREDMQFRKAEEELHSMVTNHLKMLRHNVDLGTFKEIVISSLNTILAACGLEHRSSDVYTVPAPSICTHVQRVAAGQTSLMKGFCSYCFDSFVKNVVETIMEERVPLQLSLGL